MAFREDSISHTQVFEWCHCFREGRTSVEGDKHPGWPLTSRNSEMIDKVRDLLRSQKINDQKNVQRSWNLISSCHTMVTEDLGMRHVAAQFILWVLTAEQKESHLFKAADIFWCTESDADLIGNWQQNMDLKLWSQNKGPVSRLESAFIPMAKERSSSWKKGKSTSHRFFFDEDGVVHHEFASAGQTVNMEYYTQFCSIYKMQYTTSDQRGGH